MINKRKVLIVNIVLLLWFSLAMIGFRLNDKILVTEAYKEDFMFFIIFVVCIILFYSYEKIGKYILNLSLIHI